MSLNFPVDTSVQLSYSSFPFATQSLDNFTTSNYISNISNILINNINTKQNILTASTNILGIGSSISALDYAKITLNKPANFQSDWTSTVTNKPTNFQSDWLSTVINKPSTFPADMTNIYNKTEVNTISNNNSNYTTITSNILSNLINTNSNYTTITSNILNTKIDVNNVNISNLLYNTNYTDERPYPPKIFNSSSSQSTITYLGQNPIYSETITLDTSGITYGSGIYEIYSSENNTTSISLSGTGNNVFNVVNDDNYSYALFNSNGTFTTNSNLVCDILVVGGGASGNQRHSGGGGAGALIYSTNMTLSAGTYTINIGAGGIAPAFGSPGTIINGNNGGDSEIILDTTVLYRAKGGGYGSGNATNSSGGNGGSGGGCTGNDRNQQTVGIAVNTNIINGESGFTRGNSGGKGDGGGAINVFEEWSGGGGGGAGSAGSNSTLDQGLNTNGGNGGNGLEINITGTPTYYAGGGGGGIANTTNGTAGSGGLGGGGAGSKGLLTATAGTPNTGGGGGGGGYSTTGSGNGLGGNGGTGVVIIRYLKKSNETKKELFNFITNETGSEYGSFNYNSSTGIYLTTDRYIKNDYFGDFLVVKLPTQILLNRFRIYSRPSFVERAPSLWKLYGSNNNNEWEEIIEGSNSILLNIGNYSSGFYEKSISNISKSYMYFGLVVSRIIGGNSNSHTLNFTEFQLFGREILFVSFNVFNSALTNYYNKTQTNNLLDAKQAALTFSSPLTNTANTVSIDLSSKENTLTFNSPLTRTTNAIGINLSSYYNKTETDTLLTAKQATLTFTSPLTNTANTVSIDLSSKENTLTFNSPLTRTTNTIGINLSSYYNKTETDNLLNNKQNTLTAATTLLGIGSSITALDYNKITLNIPSTFPPTMTNIYSKTESDNRYLQLSGGSMTGALNLTGISGGNNPLYIKSTNTTANNCINIQNNINKTCYIGVGGSAMGGYYQNNFFIESSTGSIVLNTSGRISGSTPNMIIDTAGNVGIGTTNPTSKLYVDGAVEFNSTLTTNGSCTFNITGYGTAMTITANGIRIPSGNFPFSIQEWYLSQDLAPGGIAKSFVFHHSATGVNSKWWFNGQQTNTSSEISDERIKREINDIQTPLNKIMELKPKEYYLCDDKDYNKKFGVIAQDVEKIFPELIHTEKDYVANIYSYATYENGIITLNKDITDLINIDDELKLILDNNDKNNLEIVIDDTPYNNRYKRRFIKVVEIIDNHSFKIDIDLEINEIFIYGKKVDDFKRLDYESLYCLNIAATQELYKIIQLQQQQIEELKQRIL